MRKLICGGLSHETIGDEEVLYEEKPIRKGHKTIVIASLVGIMLSIVPLFSGVNRVDALVMLA